MVTGMAIYEFFSFPNLLLFLSLFIVACAYGPKGITPVSGFDLDRYLGTWYEIARFDHRFERELVNVTAQYNFRKDGGVEVVNRGYDPTARTWKETRGKAYFTSSPDTGQLKVTFFWPFYGGYNIIELDREQYSYALVCGPDKSYLWILARNPKLEPDILQMLVGRARELGFDTDKLIYVRQDHAAG